MGGKTGTTTQQSSVSIPPEVLARYNSVNARAERTAEQPFTPYGGEFVAPLTGTQQAGISNINQAQGMATPYYNNAGQAMNTGYQAGSGLALASAGEVNPEALTGQNINQYMSPYLGSVVDTTMANLRQQQNEEQSKILGNQITSGAFGGDRGRIAQANLARQQGLATGQTVSSLMNQGYGQALTTAQQQQAQQLAASQANRAALAGAGQSLYSMGQGYGQGMAGLGTQAQESALKGAQAQLGAGTVQQQTQQAKNTADYNQFLQQQGYPFQVAQFLANIAMGTGALSGSSQQGTTTSPQSFFSDRRLKDDIEKIGKTFDGQDIVRYKYKGEPGTRIGLIAQDVEKHHPEAVGLAGGYRTVDYDKATDDAAERGHFAGGGLAGAEGGAVMPEMAGMGFAHGGTAEMSGMGFASGGAPDINSMMSEILNAHQGMYPYGKAGMYGQTSGRAGAYGTSQMQTPTRGLMRVDPSAFVRPVEQPGAGGQAMQGLNAARNIGSAYTEGSSALFGSEPTTANPQGGRGWIGRGGDYNPSQGGIANTVNRLRGENPPTPPQATTPRREEAPPRRPEEVVTPEAPVVDAGGMGLATGGLVRGHYAMGGLPFSEAGGYIPDAVLNDNEAEKNKKAMDSFAPKAPGAGQSGSGSGSGPGLLGTIGQIGGAIKGAETIGSAAMGAAEGISTLMAMLPAFSDRRLKDDIEKIGKTFDGQDIVRYRYKGEPATQIGLIAQDVEKHHPDAVGLAGGYRTVDYRKATEDAADRGHFAGGGLAGMRHGYETAGRVVGTDPVLTPEAPVDGLVIPPEELDARMNRRLVRTGILNPLDHPGLDPYAADRARTAQYESGNRDVRNPNPQSSASGPLQITNRLFNDVAPGLGLTGSDRRTPGGQAQIYNAVRSRMEDQSGDMTGPQFNGAWFLGTGGYNALKNADPNANAYEVLQRAAPRDVEDMFGNNSTILNRNMTAAEALQAAITRQGTGGGNTQSAGLAGGQNASTGLVPGQYPRATQEQPTTPSQQLAREVLAASNAQRSSPNWMQRNQDWLVPLLSGVGAMASSPSRYLGAALLQGVGGGAQQYAAMQNKAEEQNIARQRLTTEQLGAVNQAGQLDVSRLREENEARRTGLTLYNNWRQNFRQVTLQMPGADGRPVPTQMIQNSQTGANMTPAQFAQEEARILRDFGLTRPSGGAAPGQTTTGAVVAPPPAAPSGQDNAPPAGQGNAPPVGQGNAPQVAAPPNTAAATPSQAQPPSTPAAAAPQGQPSPTSPPATPAETRHQEFVDARIQEINAAKERRDIARAAVEQARASSSGNVGVLEAAFATEENQYRHLTEQEHTFANGVKFRIRPGATANLEPPPPVQPNSARIDPNTGVIQSSPVNVGYASTGGLPVSPGIPRQNIEITNDPNLTNSREDNRRISQEFMSTSQGVDDNAPNLFRFATALKILEARGQNSTRAELAQTLRGLGLSGPAEAILSTPETSAAITAAKTQIQNAITSGSQAFPRMTQSEFATISNRMMPSGDMTPDSVRQLMQGQLAQSMFTSQLRRDWSEASQQGVQNFTAFADRWRRQNPPGVFMDAADRLLGNLRGQNLPSQFTEGVLYVMPTDPAQYRNAPAGLRQRFAQGEMFVATGVQTNPETGVQDVGARAVPRNVDAFDVYRRAPGLQLYGVQ